MATTEPINPEFADMLQIPKTSLTAKMCGLPPGFFTTRFSFVFACDHDGELYFGMITENTITAIVNAKLRKCAAWLPLCGDGEFMQPDANLKAEIEKLLGESSPTFPSVLAEAGWSETVATSLKKRWKSIYDKYVSQTENCYDVYHRLYDAASANIIRIHADVERAAAKVADLEQQLADFRIFPWFRKKRKSETTGYSAPSFDLNA